VARYRHSQRLVLALAQGLAAGEASTVRRRRSPSGASPTVLLADLCRAADQAMLHDARVVVPGVQELVEAHRTGVPPRGALAELTFDVPERGYRLLLGLRRPRHWVSLRRHAFDAALTSLLRQTDVVVADIEADVEGVDESGATEVEDRNVMARTVATRAAVIVVVGGASMQGLHALVRTIGELVDTGIAADRLLPVINRAPKRPRLRAELTTSLAELLGAGARGPSTIASPVFLPERPVDAALRDAVPLPAPLPRLVARAAIAVFHRADAAADDAGTAVPEPVVPGSLAPFTHEE
jgi:hypothetical protein